MLLQAVLLLASLLSLIIGLLVLSAVYGYLPITIIILGTSITAIYVYVKSLKPTRCRLEKDLNRLASVVPVDEYLRKDYAATNVVQYYASTTFRDYKLLAAATGSNAMHSCLKPARSLPYRCGHLKQLLYVIGQMGDAVSGGKVLEVGFGKGSNSMYLADLFPNAQFLGVDLVPDHVDYATNYAQMRGLGNVRFAADDASNPSGTTKAAGPFDVIFGIESFCHVDTPERLAGFLRFAAKALKPNGRLVIVDGYRSSNFDQQPKEIQQAMMLAESGFRIRTMTSKPAWRSLATSTAGLTLLDDTDLTTEALAFWAKGWKLAHVLLACVPWLLRTYIASSAKHGETG
ncbi:hypothetical protein Agub_g3159, partial [Astrephomene gubernaculifera]